MDLAIELGRVLTAKSEQEGRILGIDRAFLEVTQDEFLDRLVAIGGEMHSPMVAVGGKRTLDVAGGEILGRLALPACALAVDRLETGRAVRLDQSAEGFA